MVDPMPSEEVNLAAMAETLAKSQDYRVLRRLVPRTEFASFEGQTTRTGIMLDVETTGLDTAKDEIIELAMVKFTYLPDDRIARITDIFSSFNEPRTPIPAEITDLTGITDETVLGHRIDPAAVAAFASDAVLLLTTQISTASLPSAIGHCSSKSRGLVRQLRWNGENTDLMDRGWGICWPASGCFTRHIERSTIAAPSLKSWLAIYRRQIDPPSPPSWNAQDEKLCAFGPNSLLSN